MKSVSNWMTERGADSCWSSDKRKFREPEITQWVIDNILTPLRTVDNKEAMDQAKLRKLDAEARIAEMSAREKAETLIPVQFVEASISKFSSMLRTSMLQIATTQTQTILEAATDTRTLKRVLTDIITERLTEVGSAIDTGDFLDDDELTQYSEDQENGHNHNDSVIQDSVSDSNGVISGVSGPGPDPDDSNEDPEFFDD
ncbi:hypothetical protein NGC32_06375 [Kluyvera cryocrescens]|uniref:hypothetical protein n=1 Tax=Kluyvera cryocrescens TaxID=580 RepID=UPI002DB5F7EE|nr:hypothetical protein [Kluyvera cryocrescens]MEB7712351.1 hypothetical protein [Kluyvera cryocrescens]